MPLSTPLRRIALGLLMVSVAQLGPATMALGDHTPNPTTVTLPGSFQTELGCPGDWQPECMSTALTYDGASDRWVGNFTVPAGNWEYKVAINGTWDENYGVGGVQNGPNVPLSVASQQNVTFVYDHHTHVITHSVTPIVVAPGSFQSEVGCPGDWMPDCLGSQLLDADLDGVFSYSTTAIPAGSYEFKIALGLTWDLNYGAGGVQNGPNIPFDVPAGGALVTFFWNSTTLVPTVTVDAATPTRRSTWGSIKQLYR
jgi:hypothetical protein